ncbi:hypothetical protein FQA47_022007 [Oryzias melastigma]|uniref:Uncharacterized protein n=1 Tax=Oryzias melastigma TaxID=30732 RepID=A0A834FQH7_ORYME|nr:hypothetical protein FQA47_022007 [Oryzias melastigma]
MVCCKRALTAHDLLPVNLPLPHEYAELKETNGSASAHFSQHPPANTLSVPEVGKPLFCVWGRTVVM